MFPLKNIETLVAENEQPANKARKPFKRKRQLSKREPDEDPVGEKPKSKKSQGINETHNLPNVRNYPRQNPSISGAEGIVAVKKKPKHKTNQSVCVDEASSVASSRGKGKQKQKKQGNPNLAGANSFDATTEKSKQKKKGLSLTEGGSIAVTEKPKQKNRNLNGTGDIIVEKVKVENRKFQNQRKNEVMTPLPGKEKPKMKKQQFQSTEWASGSVAGNTVKPKAAFQPVFVSKKKKPVKGQMQTKVITKEENLGQKLKKKKKAQTVNVIGWQQLEKDLESCVLFNGDIEGASALPECSYQSNDSLMRSGCGSEKDVIGKKLSKKMKSLQLSTSVDKQSENASKKLSKVKKGGGSAKKKKTNIAKEKPYVIETETFDNQRLISKPKELFKIGKDAYIVVLLPGQSLYVHGLVSVQVLVGRVMVLGYRMDELEKQNIFSFNSHALLSINATEGHKLNASRHSYLLDYGLSRQQLEEAAKREVEPLVIFELRKTVLPIAKQLTIIGNQQVMVPKDRGHNTLYGLIVTEENCHKYALMEESAEWRELMENVQLYFECGNAPRLVLCGGKGVGKSTLFRYVVNRLLSKKGTVVQCLDTDPGQSELSLPSCLSLTQVCEPLLGPAYTHHANPSSANVKQIMVGVVSPQFGLQRYIKAVKDLLELSRKHPDRPLVVNTMGWTVGTGLDLMLDLIRIMSPSHVIQIQRNYAESNFAVQLSDFTVQNYLGGICTKSNNCELHYNLTEVKALSGSKVAGAFTPKLFRELAVMLQLSDILIDFTENPSDQEDGSHTLIIPWPEVVLHVCGSKIPKARILQVLNGNLVALCQVDPKKVEFIAPDLPKQLTNDLDFGQCWGWGVVRGIDPLTKSLHILTSVRSEIIRTKMNAIVKPELYIPDRFYNFFTKGEGPYFQKIHRSGAGRLKISRQIKPKMPKFGPKKDN